MANRDYILDNVADYTAKELTDYIKEGAFTFDELISETQGFLPVSIRKEVERLLSGSESEDWERAKLTNTIEAYEVYLRAFPAGKYAAQARNAITALQRAFDDDDDDELDFDDMPTMWEDVDKNSEEALKSFINENKSNLDEQEHVREAKRLLNKIKSVAINVIDRKALVKRIKQIRTDKNVLDPDGETIRVLQDYLRKNKISISDITAIIEEDNNIFNEYIVRALLDDGYIMYEDLQDAGIDNRFIEYLAADTDERGAFPPPPYLESIPKVCSEVYLWGIPSSGKSCALGAILSVANNGKAAKTMAKNPCQGYGYMNTLANCFHSDGEVGTLPPGTPTGSTYEMEFDLEDWEDKTHPITCVDLAGELLKCMYKRDASIDLNDEEQDALDTLTRVLVDNRTGNRKFHFFVIEYGAEDRKYDGLPQLVYLEGALRYIENTGIFRKDTSGIFIVVSKVDKIKAHGAERNAILKEYIEDNYLAFYAGLKKICRDNEINNGLVDIIPFSLGKVCFQNYCLFDEAAATKVVETLINRTKGVSHGKMAKVGGWLKS